MYKLIDFSLAHSITHLLVYALHSNANLALSAAFSRSKFSSISPPLSVPKMVFFLVPEEGYCWYKCVTRYCVEGRWAGSGCINCCSVSVKDLL